MKILIAGAPETGQREAITKLTGTSPPESLAGFTMDHTFRTRYFSTECGLWADEIEDLGSWAADFNSTEAAEVREALVLFIYTFNPAAGLLDLRKLGEFTEMLPPGSSLALPTADTELDAASAQALEQAGFDVLEPDELVATVHTALYDAQEDAEDDGSDQGEEEDDDPYKYEAVRPSRDLNEIMAELIAAKESDTMTDEEKKQLADRLAAELI